MNRKFRLMVIDDEPIVGKRLKMMLEKESYSVESFIDAQTAISTLEKRHFDIIITDLKMEGVDGMKILEIVRKKNPDTKVIIITGFGKKETAAQAFEKGVFDFIIKPFKIDELKQVLKKAEKAIMKDM